VLKCLKANEVEEIINKSKQGNNTKFLKASHSLWYRFKNYEKSPPLGLLDNDNVVSILFTTFSQRTKYTNLYEICTLQGMEGNGYARNLWREYLVLANNLGMERLKISCTPESIKWHIKNGLVFWGVDKQGSLKSDQPLKLSIEEQNEFREKALTIPNIARPSEKICDSLKLCGLEYVNLSLNKTKKAMNAINFVGKYWLRDYLWITD